MGVVRFRSKDEWIVEVSTSLLSFIQTTAFSWRSYKQASKGKETHDTLFRLFYSAWRIQGVGTGRARIGWFDDFHSFLHLTPWKRFDALSILSLANWWRKTAVEILFGKQKSGSVKVRRDGLGLSNWLWDKMREK